MAEQNSGRLRILDSLGNVLVTFDGEGATLQLGSREVLALDAGDARLVIGGQGLEGHLAVRDESGHSALLFDAHQIAL